MIEIGSAKSAVLPFYCSSFLAHKLELELLSPVCNCLSLNKMASSRGCYRLKHQQLESAIAAHKNGEMSIRKASEHFDIPFTTLRDKISGKHSKKHGRPTTFTEEEEEEICDILLSCMKIGVPLNKRMLLRIVRIIGQVKGKHIFRKNKRRISRRNDSVFFHDCVSC